jgi:hypothetical protein
LDLLRLTPLGPVPVFKAKGRTPTARKQRELGWHLQQTPGQGRPFIVERGSWWNKQFFGFVEVTPWSF